MVPKILNMYWEEYEKKRQEDVDLIDYTAWLNGRYIMRAIGATMVNENEYPEKPFHVLNKEEEWKNENPTKAAAIDFGNYAAAFNRAKGVR